ncbi:MAG: flagellar hook-length control protein FliK [Gammaproteobacteria bacterium]|nr:flagellar hook-length control protein FliK [Gammaproteobacteria bacterium]
MARIVDCETQITERILIEVVAVDIKLPVNTQTLTALAKVKDHPLAQKIGQALDATVIRIDNKQTGIALKINDHTLEVQSNRPLPLEKGQPLKLIVTRLIPTLEFKIDSNPSQTKNAPVTLTEQATATATKLDIATPDKTSFNRLPPPSSETIQAKVLSVGPDRIQLSFSTDKSAAGTPRQTVELPVDKNSVQNLKPGQNVIVEIARHGQSREIKIVPATLRDIPTTLGRENTGGIETLPIARRDIPAVVRDILPRHETPTVLLNQLIADLPSLQTNKTVSETLIKLAQEILQNLQRPEQLTDGKTLKTAVERSGLFLEARLLELTKQQPDLLKSDFKGLLLKLIQILKPETAPQSEKPVNATEMEQLKNLLQKTENSVAKLTLDQLASLPKDDSPKQVWLLEIPFLGESKAQSVKIEIERDKRNGSEQDEQTKWSVFLTITPPNLGTLHCKLSYLDDKINAHFWSEQETVTGLIKQNIEHLKKQLEAEGLNPGYIDALDGTPPRQESAPLIPMGLINEKA